MTTRRRILKLAGGGIVLAAGGIGAFTVANGPSSVARSPWRTAGDYDDPRKAALSYAILAPNPHNLQPWRVALEGEDALTISRDPSRALPQTDPYDRQITLGFGAFLEVLRMAAAAQGFEAEVEAFPSGSDMNKLDGRPVAHVRLRRAVTTADPLFQHVLARRTNRETYRDTPVPKAALSKIEASAHVGDTRIHTTTSPELVDALRELTWRAHEIETFTNATHMESVNVMRIGRREVAANPDGITLEGPMITAAKLAGAVTRSTLADPSSSAFRQGLDMYREKAASAPAFVWITNDGGTREGQLNAGAAWLRLNLAATAEGLAVHPWSQSLQEYPQMASLYDDVHALIGGGGRIQMLARIGYASDVGPSPRWPLETVLA